MGFHTTALAVVQRKCTEWYDKHFQETSLIHPLQVFSRDWKSFVPHQSYYVINEQLNTLGDDNYIYFRAFMCPFFCFVIGAHPSHNLSDHPSPVSTFVLGPVFSIFHQTDIVPEAQFLRNCRQQVHTEALKLWAFWHCVWFLLRSKVNTAWSLKWVFQSLFKNSHPRLNHKQKTLCSVLSLSPTSIVVTFSGCGSGDKKKIITSLAWYHLLQFQTLDWWVTYMLLNIQYVTTFTPQNIN